MDEVARGEVLWTPPSDAWATSRLGQFVSWLEGQGQLFDDYHSLWDWSTTDVNDFWAAFREFADLGDASGPALAEDAMPGAVWFPGSTWNYAAEALRHDIAGPVVIAHSQTRGPIELTMPELRAQVGACRAGLERLGVGRGDLVAAYLPNIPEALVAFLAAASLGAVWTSAPPEFGVRAVVDRFSQVEPRVLLAVEGYDFGDRRFDRRDQLGQIRAALPGLAHTVVVPYPAATLDGPGVLTWDELVSSPPPTTEPLAFEAVAFDHPLYVLYSSGTTGRPKAIVHGHGGIICEHTKALTLHHDLGPGDRFFWFSTTGWMMWNLLVSGLLAGSGVVLFDGDPTADGLLVLWRLAAETRVTELGLSAPFIDACRKADLRLGDLDLGRVKTIGATGAPLSPAAATWATSALGRTVQVASVSGGTDVCTAFVGTSPVLPVRAGEISCLMLGARVEAWNEEGESVVGEQGEMVITAPMPSMPVAFWGDADGRRLAAAYYEQHPGVWTHGDWITIFDDGACVISGRSDATLNRGGVRLGSAEIYEVLEDLPEVDDSLVIHLEEGDELVVLIVPAAGAQVDDDLRARVRDALRHALSPRHVPDRVEGVTAIPRTLSGKRVEVPVKRILQGADPEAVLSRDTLRDPAVLDDVVRLASR